MISTPEEALLLLLKIKVAQDNLPAEERLYIGGHVTLTEIVLTGVTITNALDLDSDIAITFMERLKR